MPKHRGITLSKFAKAVGPALLEDYFAKRYPDKKLPVHSAVTEKEIEEFMASPQNVQAAGILKEDFQRINDICQKGKSHVVKAYNRFSIPYSDRVPMESLAMELFLNHDKAFDYAYAWYCYYNSSSKLSHHRMPGEVNLSTGNVDNFQNEIRDWFGNLAKGKECLVTHYQENNMVPRYFQWLSSAGEGSLPATK